MPGIDPLGTPGSSAPIPDHAIAAIGVVIPVHDEQELLPRCLAAIADAAARARACVRLVLVLDRCRDSSRSISEAFRSEAGRLDVGVDVIEGDHGSVGAARQAGVVRLLALSSPSSPGGLWVAHTDADSRVPADWLAHQEMLAGAGCDLVLGTIRPDDDGDARALRSWNSRAGEAESPGHIHGANLGTRASRLLEVGGFRSLEDGEDVDLVQRMRAAGARWRATDAITVLTSARRRGRVSHGFSGHLRGLEREGCA